MNIALTGKFRAGKDAVAKYLVEKYGYTRFAFGDELKRLAHEIYPWVPREPKPRKLYQFMNKMREFDRDVWVKHCFNRIERINCSSIVITDVRQQNELDRCRAEGFIIIRVSAPDHIRIERARVAGDSFDEATLNHKTEHYVDSLQVDFDIDNSGTLDELHAQIDRMMKVLVSGESGAFGNDCPNGQCDV